MPGAESSAGEENTVTTQDEGLPEADENLPDTESIADKETKEAAESKEEAIVDGEKASENDAPLIAVAEIDLGDFYERMAVGERQLLVATVLPLNASEQAVLYSSSDAQVAIINTMGRITALSPGTAVINASCGGVQASFTLTVTAEKETEADSIEVAEIDLGDYRDVMGVGEKQLMSITVLPAEASGRAINYSSSNKDIATISGIGRISALQTGSSVITVSCGDKQASFTLTVQEESADFVPVTAVEISDHEDEVEVDKTISLSVKVLPDDATRQTVHYSSSDTSIATVNSSGEIKGVSKGDVIIYVSAGDITEEVPLKVIVATTKISANSEYLVLRPGESFQLDAKVDPPEAVKSLSYKSADTGVAEVSSTGLVKAKSAGATTVIISNEDNALAISVIVNEETVADDTNAQRNVPVPPDPKSYSKVVYASEQEEISEDFLLYLYEEDKTLLVIGEGYSFSIAGSDISNYKNTLDTDINLKRDDDTVTFTLNNGKYLPGPVTMNIDGTSEGYLYLYNTSKRQNERLQPGSLNGIYLSSAGDYTITSLPLREDDAFARYAAIAGGVVSAVAAVAYVFSRRRYWFW